VRKANKHWTRQGRTLEGEQNLRKESRWIEKLQKRKRKKLWDDQKERGGERTVVSRRGENHVKEREPIERAWSGGGPKKHANWKTEVPRKTWGGGNGKKMAGAHVKKRKRHGKKSWRSSENAHKDLGGEKSRWANEERSLEER